MTKKIIFLFLILAACVSCSKDHDEENDNQEAEKQSFDRTVLIYISGENNLSSYINSELEELRQGSMGIGNNALIVYIDNNNSSLPYVFRIQEGEFTDSFRISKDWISSSVEAMGSILDYTAQHFPARDYGLVLWGHASGWMIEDSVASSRRMAYGLDTGKNDYGTSGLWMNIYTLNKTISNWGKPLKFIFADCCQFQCVEALYELRNATEYIIGSPSEIPGPGAPYDKVTKGFFEQSDSFYRTIVDAYFSQVITIKQPYTYNSQTPLSVVKTSELSQLAEATNEVLHSFLPQEDGAYPNMANLIYYRGNISYPYYPRENVMYDMNDFILHYSDSVAYEKWKQSFDRAVVYKVNARNGWMTGDQVSTDVFKYLTDERYGGISMFVPQDRPNSWYLPHNGKQGYNNEIRNTAWYWDARLQELGW